MASGGWRKGLPIGGNILEGGYAVFGGMGQACGEVLSFFVRLCSQIRQALRGGIRLVGAMASLSHRAPVYDSHQLCLP